MRKAVLAAVVVFASIVGSQPVAQAAAYPEKVVRVIVPWPPGPTDTVARDIGAHAREIVIPTQIGRHNIGRLGHVKLRQSITDASGL